MMTTVITTDDVRELAIIAEAMDNIFTGKYSRMWGFCGDCITVSYDEENHSELYNIYSKLDFLEFSMGQGENIQIQWHNGPSVLAGMCEAYEVENGKAPVA